MTAKFDVIVIGTGPAASTVARRANREGKHVAIIESREFGGTCALRGCNPKKVYTNAADLVDQARRAEGKLARFQRASIEWADLLAFKREFTRPIIENSERSFRKEGVKTIHDAASFVDPRTIQVNGKRFGFQRALIATGAIPRALNILGEEHAVLSDDFLELADLPPSVAFIGGGYVSMEFSHVTTRFDSKTIVLHRGQRILKGFDPDLVAQLAAWSNRIGIDIRTGAEVTSIRKLGRDCYSVSYELDGAEDSLEAGAVIHGAGRTPNLSGLNLESAGIAHNANGIAVDRFMRSTTNDVVFAAGDCAANGAPQLTPTANEDARAVAHNLFALDENMIAPDYGAIPKVVFTSPCLASIGMSEESAREEGREVEMRYEDTSDWGSVRKTTQTCAGYKLLIDKESDRILGAHLLGPRAEETINLFALAMKFNLTATQMKSTLFAFPTFAADVRKML